jgi:hypothetical protein
LSYNDEKPSRAALFAANIIITFVVMILIAFGVTFLWASVQIVNAIVAAGMH